ncbi:MAG: AI-2E family transporter [Cycloclasticus sp. symbiont of Poecilosclerida sp. N]|nr:MAG: AI-2E family transporter [Cycloclasticus sp. symbiont of Poecilosclerida sp. N]
MNNGNKYAMIFIVFAVLVYLLSPVLMPFLSAALLAYLGCPLVDRLEKIKWPRSLAVTLVFAIIFSGLTAVIVILLPLIEQQIAALVEKVPAIIAWGKETALPWLQHRFSGLGTLDAEKLQKTLQDNIGGAGSMAASVLGSLTASGMALLSGFANLLLIPVVTFYLLRDWDVMTRNIHSALPRKIEKKSKLIAQEIDAVLTAFFKGQVLVMACMAIIYYVGLSIAGLEFALLIGLIAGLVSFVPYLGLIIGLMLACVASIFQLYDGSGLLAVVLVFGIAQVLESVVLTPILVGDKIGLHPVAVIFSVMAGGQLFGFTGVLLALPIAAVLLVLLRHLNDQYKNSELYTQK